MIFVVLQAYLSVCKYIHAHAEMCVQIYIHVCVCIYIYVHVCMCVRMYVCTYVCMYVRMYICTCIYIYKSMYAHKKMCIYVYTYMCICIRICVYTYTYKYLLITGALPSVTGPAVAALPQGGRENEGHATVSASQRLHFQCSQKKGSKNHYFGHFGGPGTNLKPWATNSCVPHVPNEPPRRSLG